METEIKLELVRVGDPGDEILYEDLTCITTEAPVAQLYYKEMRRICKAGGGVGVSANQVGVRENMFFAASRVKMLHTPGGVLVINPTWEPHKNGRKVLRRSEGCLSLPAPDGVGTRTFEVERWDVIVASWTSVSGHRVKPRTLSGLAAQVFQHEHDHLRGILLTSSGKEIGML